MNINILKNEYIKRTWEQVRELLKEELCLTDKEAWAVMVVASSDLLD